MTLYQCGLAAAALLSLLSNLAILATSIKERKDKDKDPLIIATASMKERNEEAVVI